MTRAMVLRRIAVAAALLALPLSASAVDDRGLEFQVGGGVVGFPGGVDVNTGAAYGALVGIEPWSAIGLELGYQGAAYGEDPIDDSITTENVNAVENGGYAALKISPIAGAVEPYALGGIGISHLNVTDDTPQPGGALVDDTFGKAPVGAGVDFHLGDFTAGVRGTYAFVFDNEAFNTPGSGTNDDDQLLGTLQLGAQF